jgi:hypothetical protein
MELSSLVRALTTRRPPARRGLGLALLAMVALRAVALAQDATSAAEDAAACAACGTCGGVMILIPILFFAVNIALLVWVARDAKSRGMDSAVLWMLLVMFTSFIGLLIYILSRPQGELVQCPHCNNKRLQASAKCPHCGNA